MQLETIQALVQKDLEATDQFIIFRLESTIPLIQDMVQYILTCGGKRIRPLLLLLSARACNSQVQHHVDLAAVIELIHTATLLHDDVVDNATLRRGHKTAHTIWGNEASVLVGDFLYSRAFQVVVDLKIARILEIFSFATHYIAEGEILQLMNCKNPDTTEEFYFDIIQRKTAKLFEIAAQFGGVITASPEEYTETMRQYGFYLGIAYQLIDDALDYSQPAQETGKNVGNDLADGKTTLPLIHALRHCKPQEAQLLREAIKTGSCNQLDQILAIIESTDAIQYTATAAKHYTQKAQAILANIPASPYRDALHQLAGFVVDRTY